MFAPFSAALDLTKLILFQPFDLSKWFVIGFAAFLSHLAGGGGNIFNYNSKLGRANWNLRSTSHDVFDSATGLPGWLIPLIGLGILAVIALVVVLRWLGARGKFIFTDCIVRNRGAIQEPWVEFKHEGNSFFLFSLLVMVIVLLVLGLAALPLWMPLALRGDLPEGLPLIFGVGLLGAVALITLVAVHLIFSFMIPLMYRRRCGAMEAFSAALGLITAHPGPVILYLLFSLVLWLAFGMIACVTTCLTCCITAIPYLGTVIMLPAYVFFMSYLLLFVRQFGPDCDPWANVLAIETIVPQTPEPPSEPPPVQV